MKIVLEGKGRDGGEVCQRKRSVNKNWSRWDSKEQPLSWKQIQAYNYTLNQVS